MDSSRKDDRPPPLPPPPSLKTRKPPPTSSVAGSIHLSPVIVHMHAPKVIHARPQDFMRVVQLLTGKQPSPPPTEAFCPPAGYGYAGGGGGPSSGYFASDVDYAPGDASGAHHHYSGDPRTREFRFC